MPLDKRPSFRKGYKDPKWDQQSESRKYLLMVLVLAFLIVMALGFFSSVQSQEGVIIHVKNFGKGMTPGLPPYRNDPEGIVLSQNFYSLMPGGREVRSGYRDLIPYADISDTVTAPIDAFTVFTPPGDSAGIVFAAGGHWYEDNFGAWDYASGGWRIRGSEHTVVSEIKIYNPGKVELTAIENNGQSKVLGTEGTRFTRDVQIGDSLISGIAPFASTDRWEVTHIVDDSVLWVTTPVSGGAAAEVYIGRRHYSDSVSVRPYFHASKEYLYTGDKLDQPQIIYSVDDTRYIRHMGVVDSFLIDTIYTLYPKRTTGYAETVADYALWTDNIRRSWDTTNHLLNGHRSFYADEFMIVNRRKSWISEGHDWRDDFVQNPEAYYVRLGVSSNPYTGTFFQVKWNDDTAIALVALYVDSTEITPTVDISWNDSVFYGKGTDMTDTLDAADVDGKWAYIYSSVGVHDVVVADEDTDTLFIRGRGAIAYTLGDNFNIDTTEAMKGMHFIRLTRSDVNFPTATFTQSYPGEPQVYISPRATWTPPTGAIITQNRLGVSCGGDTWYPSINVADFFCGEYAIINPAWRIVWHQPSVTVTTLESENLTFDRFPIRYMRHTSNTGPDTTFFILGASLGPEDGSTAKTTGWEIIRVDMPAWSGMTEWSTPPQLIAWGDTLAHSLMSFSGHNDHWNWSATNDVIVGGNPNQPVMNAIGYDDQLIVFKPSEMVGYDGVRFTQISASDGLVAPEAVVKLEKEMYWLDIDGPKKMKRRDFAGYSITKLGRDMDPIWNSWETFAGHGTNVVPLTMTPSARSQSLMTWNKRENKIYLFFAADGSTTPNRAATYDLYTNKWDGIHTLAASTAGLFVIDDTLRIITGSPTDAHISVHDFEYSDNGVGIDAQLTSSPFYLTDKWGFPVKSKLGMISFVYRANVSTDLVYINLVGDSATTRYDPQAHIGQTSWKTRNDIFRPSVSNVSLFWQWDMLVEGNNAGEVFVPHDLRIQLLSVERND